MTFSDNEFQLLSTCLVIVTFSFSIQVHSSLNTRRGARPVISYKENFFRKSLGSKSYDIRRIISRRNEQVIPTEHLILTFNFVTLSETITTAYLYRRGFVTCANCAELSHDSKSFEKTKCFGLIFKVRNYPAYSRYCPK